MSNVIMFPPSFIVVQLFRRSRPRKSKLDQLREAIEKSKKSDNGGDKYFKYKVKEEDTKILAKDTVKKDKKK